MSTPAVPEPRNLRASDADRERVANVLREAAGDGRLSMDELDERLDAVYAAKTYAELEPITRDLPQTPGGAGPAPAHVPSGDPPGGGRGACAVPARRPGGVGGGADVARGLRHHGRVLQEGRLGGAGRVHRLRL